MHTWILRVTVTLVIALSFVTAPAAAQHDPEEPTFRRETVLTGKWESFRIARGRVARTRCIAAFEELLADPRYRSRLPDRAKRHATPVAVAINPNRLTYQSEHYRFHSGDGYDVAVFCNLENSATQQFRFSLVVEGTSHANFKGKSIASVVESHFSWINDRFRSME